MYHPIAVLTNLQILRAQGCCGITQAGIEGLALKDLYAEDNPKITNVSYTMK